MCLASVRISSYNINSIFCTLHVKTHLENLVHYLQDTLSKFCGGLHCSLGNNSRNMSLKFPEHVTTYSSLCCLQIFRNHITGDSSNVCTPRFPFKPRNDGDKSPWGFIHVSKYYRSGKWHLLLVFRASNRLRQMLVMRFEHVWIGSEV